MSENIGRRSFLLGWLGSLLACWFGRSKAQAASAPVPHLPVPAGSGKLVSLVGVVRDSDDASGLVSRLNRLALPRVEVYTYDASGRLIQVAEYT